MRNRLIDVLGTVLSAFGAGRQRLASEHGFAVPTVMLMTVAAMGMASVAVMTSIEGQSGTVRDQGTKSALAVAESGVSQALLHYNRGVPPCEAAVEGEWCGPVTGMSVNGGAISYWTRVLDSGAECGVANEVECVEVVSIGTVDEVTRRVDVFAASLSDSSSTPGGPFSTAGVLSRESIVLDSNAAIHTGTATNGDLILSSNARQCGPASVGIGKEMDLNGNSDYYGDAKCTTSGGTVGQKELTLPLVPENDAPTNNNNGRLFSEDPISGAKGDVCWNGKNGNGQTSSDCKARELVIKSNSSVTLGGEIYSFCKLKLDSNAALYTAPGVSVTIYFDSPENCKYSSGVNQLELLSNTRITSASGTPIDIVLLFMGSEKIQTGILLNSNTSVNGPCDQNFIVYAPLSDVEFDSNSRFCGGIAGKSVHLDSNAEIWAASGTGSFELPGVEIPETAAHYEPYRFVECSSTTASPPNAGC